tara:strand:- start:39425 stop:39712 length:288 start_codon:yes stop_codon:yes gene_type:complete
MKNQMQSNYNTKYMPIHCSNDQEMVREGIRVPMLEPLKIERSLKSDIKASIKARTKLIQKNIILHEENVMQICIEFNKLMDNSRLNLTKFQIMKS